MIHSFAEKIVAWQRLHGRHDLPWQTTDPYAIWLSEIMLQQTQVSTVKDYYTRFMTHLPDVAALANAPEESVLALWTGLGYYSRARNLRRAAQIMYAENWPADWPQSRHEWERLPGVGRSTAAAIVSFAFRQPESILDGNVKRVLCRVFEQDGAPNDRAFEENLWRLAQSLVPDAADMPAYTQGLMDLGATVCTRTRPHCARCPVAALCQALAHQSIARFPRKKIPRALQEEDVYWLIIQSGSAFALQKRPSQGIWASLYCFPTFVGEHELMAFAQEHFQQTPVRHAQRVHRLTHRLLRLQIYALEAKRLDIEGWVWVDSGSLKDFGLPKPALKLCEEMQKPGLF